MSTDETPPEGARDTFASRFARLRQQVAERQGGGLICGGLR